jgi:hypothetical protein
VLFLGERLSLLPAVGAALAIDGVLGVIVLQRPAASSRSPTQRLRPAGSTTSF